MAELDIAIKAVRLYAELHPRPASVTQKQAAEMLGVSHMTVSKLVKSGQLSLNGIGQVPTVQIDKLLEPRAA
jgi:hypothetical protein